MVPMRTRVAGTMAAVLVTALGAVGAVALGGDDDRRRTETAATGPSCGASVPKPGGGYWRCTFSDDFKGSTLDPAKWKVQTTAASGFQVNRECHVASPRNVSVGAGVLRLTVRREAAPFTCVAGGSSWTTQYTAGTVMTWNRFDQAYGRFEFRAAFPASTQPGLHSNLWLYHRHNTYGAGRVSGEIDVAEWFSQTPNQVYPSLHYEGRVPANDTAWNCFVGAPGGYHKYVLEWTPTQMRFLYDGRLCFTRSWAPAAPLVAPQPFDHPFFVILTQALGGGHNAPVAGTTLPATTRVDYVRVWR